MPLQTISERTVRAASSRTFAGDEATTATQYGVWIVAERPPAGDVVVRQRTTRNVNLNRYLVQTDSTVLQIEQVERPSVTPPDRNKIIYIDQERDLEELVIGLSSHALEPKIDLLKKELERLATLRPGWDSYGAPAPCYAAVAWAKQLLALSAWFATVPDRVLPSADGGVVLYYSRVDRYADIEVLNEGAIMGAVSDRHAEPQVWEVNVRSLKDTFERIRAFLVQ